MKAHGRYRDRSDAGRALARLLAAYTGRPDVVVLALPRGGVPVAAEVARALAAPLDLWPVRKLGVPGREELAMGAIASGGILARNEPLIRQLGISTAVLEAVRRREERELARRERIYRGSRPAAEPRGRTVILVDDGLATGATMRAALLALRPCEPERVIVAVPVASRQACEELAGIADECVCAATPEPFGAVGTWYVDFASTSDAEIVACLERSSPRPPGSAAAAPPGAGQ